MGTVGMSESAGSVVGLSDLDLVNAVAQMTDLPEYYKGIVDEIVRRWHISLTTQPEPTSAKQQGAGKLLNATNLKLERPAKFSGDSKHLLNFLFEVEQFCDVLGVDEFVERVKLAVTLLSGRALTWWRSVAAEDWAQLGLCTWALFKSKIMMAFQDPNHVMRIRQQLAALSQRTSVQAYNAEFRGLLLEVRSTMSEHDVLFSYLAGLKSTVQQQVMLHSPMNVERAMELADHADATFWFGQPAHKPQQPPQRPKYTGGYGRQDAAGGSQFSGQHRGPMPMDLGVLQRRPLYRQPSNLSNVKCFNCGQFGHLKRNCPHGSGKGVAAGMFPGPQDFYTPEPAPFGGFPQPFMPPPPPPPKNLP